MKGDPAAPGPEHTRSTQTDAVFAALGDPTRRELLRSVASGGPTTATQLAADRDITRQAVTKHLAVLHTAGLVTGQRIGREVHYEADPAPLDSAVDWINATGAAWDRRLASLAAIFRA